VDDDLHLGGIASLESNTPSNRANLQKKAVNNSKVLGDPTINGLLLVVEVFAIF
jgi:hypothetical protein